MNVFFFTTDNSKKTCLDHESGPAYFPSFLHSIYDRNLTLKTRNYPKISNQTVKTQFFENKIQYSFIWKSRIWQISWELIRFRRTSIWTFYVSIRSYLSERELKKSKKYLPRRPYFFFSFWISLLKPYRDHNWTPIESL